MLSFTPADDLAVLVARGKLDIEAWQQARGIGNEPPWSEWAGDQLERMKRSRAVTGLNLNSSDASLRLAAVAIVAEHWLSGRIFAQNILRMAFEDAEPAIRGAALTALRLHAQFIADPTRTLRELLVKVLRPAPRGNLNKLAEWWRNKLVERIEKQMLENAGGTAPEEIVQRPEESQESLSHEDPRAGSAAQTAVVQLCLMGDEAFTNVCERAILEETEIDVRLAALNCLGLRYARSDNVRVEQFLARLVYEVSEPSEIRLSAYKHLCKAVPARIGAPATPLASRSFRFPEDVDWTFVRSVFFRGNSEFHFGFP